MHNTKQHEPLSSSSSGSCVWVTLCNCAIVAITILYLIAYAVEEGSSLPWLAALVFLAAAARVFVSRECK